MEYVDQRFEGVNVTLDGNSFRNCIFRDVIFEYAGGPVEMTNSNMDRFSFQFGGDLAQGLFTLYQLFGTDNMLAILRGYTEPGAGGDVTIQV
ncbi:hypothetical protein [Sphingomonas sp. M1-B02]|uniref:hypothetical protein n=1 Tax=Sphingomonas sp. M1-B02 TaxID=3114300 RepID=UPI00223EB568|nr:hypothetical protein [Sphingomonas sp. S6-11]UZK66183.1 hypothetical protein OKW87_17015 [Sphingomonas sp. S6-11]